jgi:hypothetical protein
VKCVSSAAYLVRAMKGRRIETLVAWQRQGRVGDDRVVKLVDRPVRYWAERILFGWLPARWHRLMTEPSHAWKSIREAVSFTVKFLRTPSFREECLLEQVRMGRKEGVLSGAEADRIENEVKDPYIQKYLRCLAVHACTVPVTKVAMVVLGTAVTAYCLAYKQLGWAESMALGIAAAAALQLMPVSPGSITRGLFVIYMMIKDRDIKSYCIAAPVAFLHVVGYLAFPLQMVSSNPALARFLAARWTRKMVQLVPVFGESGGLLEHWAFDCLFNLPLSIRRGVKVNPVGWAVGSTAATFALAGVVLLGYGYVSERWRPEGNPGSEVFSITPYTEPGGDLLGSEDGMQVQFAGTDDPVDFSPGNRNESGHPLRRGSSEMSASRLNAPSSGGERDSRGEVFRR